MDLVLGDSGRYHDHDNTLGFFGKLPITRDLASHIRNETIDIFLERAAPLLWINAHIQADLEESEIWKTFL